MNAWGTAQLALLAAALFGAATAAVVALAYPRLRVRLARLPPHRRAAWLVALAVLPVVAALVLTALCFAPKLLAGLVSTGDHCTSHGGAAHPHFCPEHLALHSGSLAAWILLAALAAWTMGRLVPVLVRSVRAWRAGRRLAREASFDPARAAWILPGDLPVAAAIGLWRPRTVISRGLLRAVAPELTEAILAHERAHERRRDTLRVLTTTILSLAHLPGTRRLMLDDLSLAVEQACDEESGARLGDRLRVAQALLAAERLLQRTAPGVVVTTLSFAGSSVPPRVEALLADPPAEPRRRLPRGTVALAAVAALALLADPLHHFTETLLGFLGV